MSHFGTLWFHAGFTLVFGFYCIIIQPKNFRYTLWGIFLYVFYNILVLHRRSAHCASVLNVNIAFIFLGLFRFLGRAMRAHTRLCYHFLRYFVIKIFQTITIKFSPILFQFRHICDIIYNILLLQSFDFQQIPLVIADSIRNMRFRVKHGMTKDSIKSQNAILIIFPQHCGENNNYKCE